MKILLGMCLGIMIACNTAIVLHSMLKCDQYGKGFEAGKLYVGNCMLQQNDSILGCSRLGYIPDTISVKPELKNGGSYNINKGENGNNPTRRNTGF